MKRHSLMTASLDMLLDTMCNTFGGVCFIALLVSIISYSLPKTESKDADLPSRVSAKMLVVKERDRLTRTRDELANAIRLQKELLETNRTSDRLTFHEADYIAGIASNAQVIAKMRLELAKLEDELAKVTTQCAYSRREAERLNRLLKDMEETLDRPLTTKKRAVRTPLEREMSHLHSIDLWLRHGRLHIIDHSGRNQRQVKKLGKERGWDCVIVPGAGYKVDESFFFGDDWTMVTNQLNESGFARIYCDAESFPELCELRDALIYFGKMYNWYIRNEDTIHFVEGYDGKVQ